jgi:uncharacterized protein YbjT (DUF2867 family)
MKIAMIGATGPLGRRLTTRLLAAGHEVLAIGRSAERLAALCLPSRVADCYDRPSLTAALKDARVVVSCASSRTTPHVLEALPAGIERVVLTGSTRRFTKFPDHIARQLIRAEALMESERIPGTIVYPTMICGEDGERNVQRIAAFIRRFGAVPLPDAGRVLVRPIYTGDVAACLEAALFRPDASSARIVVAGRDSVSYADLVRGVAAAIGARVRIVSVPASLLMAAAPLTRFLPGVPAITVAEVRRLLEDKSFPIDDMRRRLGVEPIGLEEMLARAFSGAPNAK